MSESAFSFGIDLGTSSCSLAYVVDDPRQRDRTIIDVRTVAVPTDEAGVERASDRIPSMISIDCDDRRRRRPLFGWDVVRLFRRARKRLPLLRRGREFLTSVKSDLGSHRVYRGSQVGDIRTPADATAALLGELVALARRHSPRVDLRSCRVVITVPASFSVFARRETIEAAEKAGLRRELVELVDEPVAALLDLLNDSNTGALLTAEPRNVLVFDYGGGTCDLALVRARFDREQATGLYVENLAISAYRRLGGDDIDKAVMADIVWAQLPEAARALPSAARRRIEDTLTPTVARELKEAICRRVEASLHASGGDWRKLRARDIEAFVGWERPLVGIDVPRRFRVSSAQFEGVMQRFICDPRDDKEGRSLLRPVLETLARAGLSPSDLDVLVLHGGSSQNPYARRLLEDFCAGGLFARTRVVPTPYPLLSVARGAALACYWKHVRGIEIVRPIMAEDLGVMVADGSVEILARAGTPLPYPDDESVADGGAPEAAHADRFSVPTGEPREMLVPVTTGRSMPPRIAGAVKVALSEGTGPGAPVRIKLRVDHDKTLRWWFSVGGGEFVEASAVDDPWASATPSPEERELAIVRQSIKALVELGDPVPGALVVSEASLLRRAGRPDEALEIVEDLLVDNPSDALGHNMRGLVFDDLGRHAEALASYAEARRLVPDGPLFWGNYGASLLEAGSVEQAVPALRHALTLNPGLMYVHRYLGQALRMAGDEAAALNEYRRALELARQDASQRPDAPEAWYGVAGVYVALGDHGSADMARQLGRDARRNAIFGGAADLVIAGKARSDGDEPADS
jgi:molecular chaperone DnaK